MIDHPDKLDQPSLSFLRGLGLRLEGPFVGGGIVSEELKVGTGAPFIDFEQQAVRIGQMPFEERLVNPLNIDIDAMVRVIQKQFGVIAAMRFDSLVTKNLGNNWLAKDAAELDAVI